MTLRGLALALLLLPSVSCDRRRYAGPEGTVRRAQDIIPKIERAVGLKFKAPPKIEARSRAQVREYLVRMFNESRSADELRREEQAYKLFGLLPDTLDMRRFLLELLTEQIVGYYDPATKSLYVVEDAPEEFKGITLTHELVHALQDQYLNLDSIQKSTENSDRRAAAHAVLEGQATYEQMQADDMIARLPGGWDNYRQLIRDNQSAMPLFTVAPLVIQETILFPYLSGADFVRRFEQQRPSRSLLLDRLPISTEQILSDSAYFGAVPDEPTPITFPNAPDKPHEETMGAFGTRLFIYQHHRNNTVAIRAAQGWEGDRYRIVRTEEGPGIVWVSVWESAVDAAEFVDAVGQGIMRRYGTGSPRVTRGARTYTGRGRTVVITPLERGGKNVVMFVDVPEGASSSVLDPARITIGR